jgi:hypothetical protein
MTWPHRPVLPTVGGSPNVVAHGGRNFKRRGSRRQMYISPKFWFDQLFFENHGKLNIKNHLRKSIISKRNFLKNFFISRILSKRNRRNPAFWKKGLFNLTLQDTHIIYP